MVTTVVRDGGSPAPRRVVPTATARFAPRPAAAPSAGRGRDRADAVRREAPERTPRSGVPSWKRRLLDSLASELARRGAARSRIGDGVAADSIDERIERLARELRARARDRTGYDRPAAVPTGVAVNQSA